MSELYDPRRDENWLRVKYLLWRLKRRRPGPSVGPIITAAADVPLAGSLPASSPRLNVENLATVFSTQPCNVFGSEGSGNGEFDSPWGIAVDDQSQRLYVVDSDNHCVQVFEGKHQGKFIRKYGEGGCGNKPGQFCHPSGICIQAGTGNIVVADTNNHRIQILRGEESITPLSSSVYFVDDPSEVVKVIEGPIIDSIHSEFNNPQGVCSNERGHLIVCDTLNHRVLIFDSRGEFVRAFGSYGTESDHFNSPFAVCVDQHGLIHVADFYNFKISLWSPDGEQVVRALGVDTEPRCLCVDRYGRIVFGCDDDCVLVIDQQSGKLMQVIGAFGAGPGQFSCPAGICVDQTNTLYVTDYYNHRVQVFS